MGVLMVRKDVKWRTSLLMGISLSLLLGGAAAFFIFALPQDLLESLTTSTGLARIMVQAEPPISPNDRALLSALAGVGTAGLGWVLIDWLLFARAGISALIKPRADDYEEDEADYYRPSNPLDLVVPDSAALGLITPPPPILDPRRPLSARTDIGDPPTPLPAGGRPEAPHYNIAVDHLLPPIGQLLPDVPPIPPAFFEQAGTFPPQTATMPPEVGDLPTTLSESADAEPAKKVPGPLILPTAAEVAAAARGDAFPQPAAHAPEPSLDPLFDMSAFAAPAAEPASEPRARAPEGPFDAASQKSFELPPIFPTPPQAAPAAETGALSDIFASFPPNLRDGPMGGIPLFTPAPETRLNWSGVEAQPDHVPTVEAPPPAPVLPPVMDAPASPSPVPTRDPASGATAVSLDSAPLGDLLARLEQGMQRRRPTSPPPIPLQSFLPTEPARRPLPVYAAAPAQTINPPPPVTPVSIPAVPQHAVPVVPPGTPVQPPAGEGQSGLLDQPLHVALDVLRNRVRRSG